MAAIKEHHVATDLPSSGVLRFNLFEVDLRAGELRKAGRKVKLQIQPFRVLAMLLEHPGEVVTREEFQRRLWPAGTFVDFDHSLNTAIKKLRQALCDDTKKSRFVETLPRRGYRFIGSVQESTRPSLRVKTPLPSWVGHLARICGESSPPFVLVPVDEGAAEEREKLEAANDDVGLSVLIASQRLLMVPNGTQVRVLDAQQSEFRCEVRILEGEHYGKTALVPRRHLAGLA
jgi:DNA-binding winged helix-turn-helix (wHTH) protein